MRQGRTGQNEEGQGRDMPVRLHFDVFAQHVEAHLLAGLYVILQGCICRRCVDPIWPESLHIPTVLYSVVHGKSCANILLVRLLE